MSNIVVAIPTFRRPRSLARLLAALEGMRTNALVSVLVADNDAERHEGFNLCMRRKAGFRWPLEAIVASERGIAPARNALVEHALQRADAEFIAMIDDDEWPSPQWLDEFQAVQRMTGAELLQGSILFAREGAEWASGFDGIASIRHETGPVTMLQGAGNLFIRRTCFDRLSKPYFDPAFALSGGEDRDFFIRLAKSGCLFAWANEAIAHGEVARERLSWKWALRRAYGIGNSDMRLVLKHRPGIPAVIIEGFKIAGATAAAPFISLRHMADPSRRLDGLRLLFRAAGKASAMLGLRYDGYTVTHGE